MSKTGLSSWFGSVGWLWFRGFLTCWKTDLQRQVGSLWVQLPKMLHWCSSGIWDKCCFYLLPFFSSCSARRLNVMACKEIAEWRRAVATLISLHQVSKPCPCRGPSSHVGHSLTLAGHMQPVSCHLNSTDQGEKNKLNIWILVIVNEISKVQNINFSSLTVWIK